MHGSAGLHSAMAIKRQRRLREQAKRRAAQHERDRRLSSRTDSVDSMGDRASTTGSAHALSKRNRRNGPAPADHQLATSIGMLHLGVCFFVLGLFLIGSGLLPDDVVTWRNGGWWNELVATGLFVASLGVFLISLNRVMSRKEEEHLNDYVASQLVRSRSGHRLEMDVETGCLTTKQHRKQLAQRKEDIDRGLLNSPCEEEGTILPVPHSPVSKVPPQQQQQQQQQMIPNGDAASHLEKILEEDVYEKNEVHKSQATPDYDAFNKETMSTTTTASLSPGTPSETRELINNGGRHHYTSRAMIGAMPAVAVRHERRKGQEKRSKRPSQLYIGGPWLPPTSPSPMPSPNGLYADSEERLPEYYLCGKVSALQIIVGCILVGAIILIVGLVQLVPNATDADHRYILLGSGTALIIMGFLLTGVRCFCIHCRDPKGQRHEDTAANEDQGDADEVMGDGGDGHTQHGHHPHHHHHHGNQLCVVNSIDGAMVKERKEGASQVTSPSELDSLIGKDKENSSDT